ncbi:MAG: hypothetical protein M3R31_00590 [Pseudomonadota bacterium]|nr:hypothetical protein [Pseudomonadota bacterium]
MPEYLSPGVYVEEVDAGTQSIPGVSTSIDSVRLQALVAELKKTIAAQLPEWTDSNEADPGVTLLELFAWLTENLLYRAHDMPERGRAAALRAITALSALAYPITRASTTVTRPYYFSGQLLDAATLQAEQDYHRDKLRRHNRVLHGFGIVSGLGVHVEPSSDPEGGRIIVDPGYAIDRRGEEIALCAGAALAAPSVGDEAIVSLRSWEHPCPLDLPARSGELGVTRIEEVCVIGFAQTVSPPALALARLIRADGGWSVDTAFAPPRAAIGTCSSA